MKDIDVKSMIIGVLLSACIMLCIAATNNTDSNITTNGRFQLNGQTGKLWRIDTTTGETLALSQELTTGQYSWTVVR